MSFRQVHRWVSLTVAAIWIVQAITGTLSVFRWELDDWSLPKTSARVDYAAVGAKVDSLARAPNTTVSSVWTSGTHAGRFDVHYAIGDAARVMRIGGDGRVLRERSEDALTGDGAIWDTITNVHISLMQGDRGEWLIGISGILLLSNIVLGLKLAWPKRGTWRKTLLARPVGGTQARLYGWHRKVGLWLAFPALVSVTAGIGLAFADPLEVAFGAELPEPATAPSGPPHVGFAEAVSIAHSRFPASTFSGVSLPAEDSPWYRIRLRNAGELPRSWGTTVVWVGASDGRVLQSYDAAAPRPGRAITDSFYAIHTGQAGYVVGRFLILTIGLWLLTMISLGIPLWWVRSRGKRRVSGRR